MIINSIPKTWYYNDRLGMLYLFYQISDELLYEKTLDTYSLPLHNCLTLINEINEIYHMLQERDIVKKYYSKYIPVIIDELLDSINEDYILKKILDKRLDSIRTGFTEAKKNDALLKRWLNIFQQSCSVKRYREQYILEITKLVVKTNDRKKLIYCVKNFYISLIAAGYSRKFLYDSVKKYFNNSNTKISSPSQVYNFLEQFSCQKVDMEFLILMDIATVDYFDSISDNLVINKRISKINVLEERNKLNSDTSVEALLKDYDYKCHNAKKYQKISIIRYQTNSVDPYRAIEDFQEYIKFLQAFSRYFKHYYPIKQIYKVLIKNPNNYYKELKSVNKLLKRPYITQEIIDSRIKNILSAKAMSYTAFVSLAEAIQMHAEALDSRNLNTMLKNFWTAMETLFANSFSNSHDSVLNGVLSIIQKTYILKLMRSLYAQLQGAINVNDLKDLGIQNFKEFVIYFSSNSNNSDKMKKIYTLLSLNPLLRSRIYEMRKCLSTGKNIEKFLNNHKKRIEWQIKRLYRTRNIATHLGEKMSYINVIINHLHNYFDFVINYVLCKSENGDYVSSISTLVFEAQNDNKIHAELIKTDNELSITNYEQFLFGPDSHIINYKFEC